MENVETPMSSNQSVGGGKPFRLSYYLCKVADLILKPSTGPVRLKLCPKQCGLTRPDFFEKLSEAECIAQLELVECSQG